MTEEDKDLHIGVAVVLYDRYGYVLLGKRKSSHGAGKFQAPGGHAEPNESFEQTCGREVQEETALRFAEESFEFICYQDNYFEEKNKWYRTFFYGVECPWYSRGSVINTEPDKCEGWDWYPINDLPQPMFEWEGNSLVKIRAWAAKLDKSAVLD